MAQNYGSLAVRVLLQPLEENARLLFSKLGAELAELRQGKGRDAEEDQKALAAAAAAEAEAVLAALGAALVGLLKAVSLVGLVAVCFGVHLVAALLAVLPGAQWSSPDAVATLQWYCGYVLLLGLNGTLEAFVFATADRTAVAKLTAAHAGCSLLFASLCWPALRCLGPAGLVAANCATVAARAAYASFVVRRFFEDRSPAEAADGGGRSSAFDWRAALPDLRVASAFAAAAALTAASEAARSAGRFSGAAGRLAGGGGLLRGAAVHVGLGASAFAAVAAVVVKCEAAALADLRRLALRNKPKAE